MFKGLKKIIVLLIMFFSLSLSFNINSADSNEKVQNEVEEQMEDISKRVILSLFGKQALSWYDVETDINYVNDIEDGEINKYTQPFNKNNFALIRSYIIITLTLSFIMFSIYIFWITKEGILKTQQSGTFLGQNWNTIFTISKVGIVMLLLFPIYTPYSVGHLLIFKIAGYSNYVSKEITTTIIENQPKTFATTKFPSASGKKHVSEAILQYATCIKLTGNSEEVEFNFIENNGKLESLSNFKECSLKITFGLDKETTNIINDEVNKILGFKLDYNKIQIEILKNLFESIIKETDEYTETFFLSENKNLSQEKKYLLENSIFKDYSLKYANNEMYINHWEGYCDNLKNFSKNNSTKSLTLYEKEQYMFLAARCLSHSVVKRLVYPTEINDFSKYMKTKNYLTNNNLEICSHDYNYSGNNLKTRSLIKETLPKNYNKNLNEIETALQAEIKEISIEDCLKKQCSNLLSENSNAYMCTNVIYLYNKIKKNIEMEKSGFLTLGAYMYNMFDSGNLNDNAKKLYNGFDASFTNVKSGITTSNNSIYSFKYKFKNNNINYNIKPSINQLIKTSSIEKHKRSFEKRIVQEQGVTALLNMGTGSENNFLGSNRLTTCLKNPIKIADGYSCGSFPEELHTFGQNLYEYGINIKVMIALYRSYFAVHNYITEDETKTGTGASENEERKKGKKDRLKEQQKAGMESFKKVLSYTFPVVLGYFSNFEEILNISGKYMIRTDEFGYLTTEKIEDNLIDTHSLEANAIAIFAAWQGDSSIATIINSALNIIIFIGLLFAYIFPLIPMYLWLVVIISWLLLLLETIAVLPLWLPSLTTPTQNQTSEIEKAGLQILLNLFLKAPLLCLGLLTAWMITNSVLGRIMSYLNFEKVFSIEYGYSISSIVDSLMLLIAYVVFLWYIISITITIIEAFYEFATSWLTGRPNLKTYGRELSGNFLRKGTQESNIIGLLNPYKRGR